MLNQILLETGQVPLKLTRDRPCISRLENANGNGFGPPSLTPLQAKRRDVLFHFFIRQTLYYNIRAQTRTLFWYCQSQLSDDQDQFRITQPTA